MSDNLMRALRALHLDGACVESIVAFADDPSAEYDDPGQLALIGKELELLAKRSLDSARDMAEARMETGVTKQQFGDYIFEVKPPHKQVRLKTQVIKGLYPYEERPEYYTEVEVAGSVAISAVKGKE